MGGHSKAAARPKISMISGPMDAKHVGGVNIMASTGSGIDHYFNMASMNPNGMPSHKVAGTRKLDVPKRSDTIAHAIRKSSMSYKDNATHSRSKSISPHLETKRTRDDEKENHNTLARSDSVMSSQSLRVRSSISRLRRRVGLDKDKSTAAVTAPSAKVEDDARHVQIDFSPSNIQDSRARDTVASSIYSTASDHVPMNKYAPYQQTTTTSRSLPITQGSFPQNPSRTNMTTSGTPAQPHRADSGTAIAIRDAPHEQRPLRFKEIMAVKSLAERMKLYEKTRDHWAYADHGLVDWTARAAAPKAADYHNK